MTRRPCWGSKQKKLFSKNLHENRVLFPEERNAFVLDHQHGRRDITCKPAISFLSSYVPHFVQRHFSHNQATFNGVLIVNEWVTNIPGHEGTSKNSNPNELWVMFQDGTLRLGSTLFQDFVKLPHPRDIVLHQIFYYSPLIGKEILSNAPGMPAPLPWASTLTGALNYSGVSSLSFLTLITKLQSHSTFGVL